MMVLLTARIPWYSNAGNPIISFINYITTVNQYLAFELVVLFTFLFLSTYGVIKLKLQEESKTRELGSLVVVVLCIILSSGNLTGMFKYFFIAVPTMAGLVIWLGPKKFKLLLIVFLLVGLLFFSMWSVSSRLIV